MSAGARWILGGGITLTLILLGLLMTSVGDEGVVHTIQLPATWDSTLYTDISGWRRAGGSWVVPVWPAHPEDVLSRLRPGDHVLIHCRTIILPNGSRFSVLTLEVSGLSGTRTLEASSDPMLRTAFLSVSLLPVLASGLLAVRLEARRK